MTDRIDETTMVANVIDESLLGIKRFIDVTEDITTNQLDFEVDIKFIENPPNYDGPYEVVPKVYSQTLPTKRKTLADDVLVHEIPTYETSNQYGYSFIIGD